MKDHISKSLEDTHIIARNWLNYLSEKNKDIIGATLVGLSGHLGSGKTTFVKNIGKILGVKEEITSPTFVIMKIYSINHDRWHRLIHIDAYRLEDQKELNAIDFEKIMSDKNNLIMMEWPENIFNDEIMNNGSLFADLLRFNADHNDEVLISY